MANDFDQCGDSCGWVAAIVAALAYGSFGVPVKYTKHIPVHPLVLQSYKTVVVFLTCWFVIFLGVKPSFTKWGVLSGFLWVIGGTGGEFLLSFSSGLDLLFVLTILLCLEFRRNLRHPNGWTGDRGRDLGLHHDHG